MAKSCQEHCSGVFPTHKRCCIQTAPIIIGPTISTASILHRSGSQFTRSGAAAALGKTLVAGLSMLSGREDLILKRPSWLDFRFTYFLLRRDPKESTFLRTSVDKKVSQFFEWSGGPKVGSVKACWEALSTTLLCYRYALSCLPRQRGLPQDSSRTVHNHPPVAYLQYELTSINKPFKFHTGS